MLIAVSLFAQNSNAVKPVQFSGVVLTEDSLQPIGFATLLVSNRFKGTIADKTGFFSFVVLPGDTIVISAIGRRQAWTYIPKDYTEETFSVVVPLERDTIMLKEVVIYPWATKQQFKEEFLALEVPDTHLDRAKRNLESDLLRELASKMGMDGRENQRYFMQQQMQALYYAGGQRNFMQMGGPSSIPIPNTLMNPLAWAQFIKALKNGDFKKKGAPTPQSDDRGLDFWPKD